MFCFEDCIFHIPMNEVRQYRESRRDSSIIERDPRCVYNNMISKREVKLMWARAKLWWYERKAATRKHEIRVAVYKWNHSVAITSANTSRISLPTHERNMNIRHSHLRAAWYPSVWAKYLTPSLKLGQHTANKPMDTALGRVTVIFSLTYTGSDNPKKGPRECTKRFMMKEMTVAGKEKESQLGAWIKKHKQKPPMRGNPRRSRSQMISCQAH